jgi:cathepsin B
LLARPRTRCSLADECDADAAGTHKSFAADKHSFSGDVTTFTDARAIQASIMRDGPLAATLWVTAAFENYASGVFRDDGGVQLGGHAVRIVGWGVDKGLAYWSA